MFENHVDGDFNDFWDKMELDKTWGTYTELLAFSTMLEIDIDVYDNIQWVKPLISIKKNSNKKCSLLYTKWSHYDVLDPLEKKEIISFDKSKISKVKKWYNICEIFTKNDEKKNSDEFLQIIKKHYLANWFPPNSAAFFLKDVYYQ